MHFDLIYIAIILKILLVLNYLLSCKTYIIIYVFHFENILLIENL